jgi:hypothetical protein
MQAQHFNSKTTLFRGYSPLRETSSSLFQRPRESERGVHGFIINQRVPKEEVSSFCARNVFVHTKPNHVDKETAFVSVVMLQYQTGFVSFNQFSAAIMRARQVQVQL